VLRATEHERLTLLPCGQRHPDGPELLAGPAMEALLQSVRGSFDVVLIDSAPLGAGVDPFALGLLAGNLVLVMRSGVTDRRLAEAKLTILDNLPVRLTGAVLNDVRAQGMYRYYSYLDGYAPPVSAAAAHLPPPPRASGISAWAAR
jgi:Mrp family chromosome partitioning ATPase